MSKKSSAKMPDAQGHFGPYGGRFVPETLMHPLQELEDEYRRAQKDPAFKREFEYYLREFCGRPTPLYFAERLTQRTRRRENLSQARGPAPHRRAQNQQRHRPDPARPAHGQDPHHRRDRRGPARRGHRHRRRHVRIEMRRLHGRGGLRAAGAQRLSHENARRRRSCP